MSCFPKDSEVFDGAKPVFLALASLMLGRVGREAGRNGGFEHEATEVTERGGDRPVPAAAGAASSLLMKLIRVSLLLVSNVGNTCRQYECLRWPISNRLNPTSGMPQTTSAPNSKVTAGECYMAVLGVIFLRHATDGLQRGAARDSGGSSAGKKPDLLLPRLMSGEIEV